MKKLFTTLMVLGLVVSSCGDASGDEKNDAEAKVDVCDCFMKAKNEKEAQACAPGKSMEELEAMYRDCDDKMSKDNSEDEMNSYDEDYEDIMNEGMDAYEDAIEEGMDAYEEGIKEGMDAYEKGMKEGMDAYKKGMKEGMDAYEDALDDVDAMMDAFGGGK